MLGKRSFPFGMTDPLLGTVNWWDPRGELAKMNQVGFNFLYQPNKPGSTPTFLPDVSFFFLRIVQNEEIHPIPIAKCPKLHGESVADIWKFGVMHVDLKLSKWDEEREKPLKQRGVLFFPLLTLKCMKLWQIWGIISQVGFHPFQNLCASPIGYFYCGRFYEVSIYKHKS